MRIGAPILLLIAALLAFVSTRLPKRCLP